jgi:TPR repeat protein
MATVGLNPPELFQKGMHALQGSSTSHSELNAVEYFRRSAELGFAPAQVVFGYLHETGRATPPDSREAFEWYKKAAPQDDPLAQWLIGRLIYAGAIGPRDLNQARSWLPKSAAHNDPFAEYLPGKIALEHQDYVSSVERFRQAAQQGLPQAQREFGLLLRDGQGIPEDKSEAYVWLLVSDEAGNHTAANDLQALEAQLGSTQLNWLRLGLAKSSAPRLAV